MGPRPHALAAAAATRARATPPRAQIFSAATPADTFTVRFLVDGGSNANITCDERLRRAAYFQPANGTIGGIAGGLPYTGVVQNTVDLAGEQHTLAILYTPHGTRNILSESVLLEQFGIETRKPTNGPPHLRLPDGSAVPLLLQNGLWYADLTFLSTPPNPGTHVPIAANVAAAAAAKLRADDLALLWGARFEAGADGLKSIAKAVRGVPLEKLSKAQEQAVEANQHRALGQAKHAPVGETSVHERATLPGERLIVDGFGENGLKSPIDGATYQFHAVCEYSSYGFTATGKKHTVDAWIGFLRSVILDARKHGRDVKAVRFDRAPEFRTPEFKARVEKELQIKVDLTSREHHEGVGRAERNNDLLTRVAESMMQRAGLDREWLLPARAYAQWLLNRTPTRKHEESRYQRFFNKVPDLTARVPYIFGTTVAIVEDVRGPKGSLEHPRGSIGRFVGIEGDSYIVWRPQRKNAVHQHAVRPLNELSLVRSGLPAAVGTVDAETQTLGDAARELERPAPSPPAPKAAPPVVDVPLGQRLEVLWSLGRGKSSVWYAGVVRDVIDQQNGRRRHQVAYDGFEESDWYWHDLASDDFEWRRIESPAPEAPVPREGPTTRLRTARAAHAALHAVENALECTHASMLSDSEQRAHYEAALFQALGDDAELFACSADRGVARSLALLERAAAGEAPPRSDPCRHATAEPTLAVYSLARSARAAQCFKATQNVVDVMTDVGTRQFIIPANLKQLQLSEQRDKWEAADQKALDAILSRPGNRLVSRSVPAELGIPIMPCVTQRRLKVDPATHRVQQFKARHCVDGARMAGLLDRAGMPLDVETSSTVADDLLIKMLLADAAMRGRGLLKADIPDAYSQGQRIGRPKTYMYLPSAFQHMRGDAGEELCIELGTPMWGEGPSGFEWEIELEKTLLEIGWARAEDVPACWRFKGDKGDCTLITIVDDLLFSESESSSYAIAERTCALLSAKYGDVKATREPDSFAGFSISRAVPNRIHLSMPQKVVEAAREHMPELLTETKPSCPSATSMQKIADAMAMPTERKKSLTPLQRKIQKLIGSLKFIERLHPRLSLVLHRLSCVMACPPPEAYEVARAALAIAYGERETGITFGGARAARLDGRVTANVDLWQPAPAELEAHADATWGDRCVYAVILTFGGAAVLHQIKKIGMLVDSSMESEAVGTSKAAEIIAYAREILRAFGTPLDGPTTIGTDNLSNQRVASTSSCPTRSKHFLRRYEVLTQRVREQQVVVKHVPDVRMPADFLTKWIPQAKLDQSVKYATGQCEHP